MSDPRQILPGATWAIDRRTVERRFRLLPDAYVTAVFYYCLAYAAAEFDVLVHSFTAMSNHFHLLLTDVKGQLPLFMERLDGLLARAINTHWGRQESLFAQGSYGAVRVETPEDYMAQLVYIQANPVKAGLVSHSRRWTGASSARWKFGETRTFVRPDGGFFGKTSKLPSEVKLTMAPLPGFDDLSNEQLDALARERVLERETELRAERKSQGKSYLGMTAVLSTDPESAPTTPEPLGKMNPRVAGKDRQVRVEAITKLREFRRMYRIAWLLWLAGDHTVEFPEGTWLMRVRHGARCASSVPQSASGASPSEGAPPPPPS
jgi:putative transposase